MEETESLTSKVALLDLKKSLGYQLTIKTINHLPFLARMPVLGVLPTGCEKSLILITKYVYPWIKKWPMVSLRVYRVTDSRGMFGELFKYIHNSIDAQLKHGPFLLYHSRPFFIKFAQSHCNLLSPDIIFYCFTQAANQCFGEINTCSNFKSFHTESNWLNA